MVFYWSFMLYSFFNSQARSRYLSFFSLTFNFILWSAGTAKSTILQVLFFSFDYYKVWSSGWDYMIRLYVKIPEEFVGVILQDSYWVVHISSGPFCPPSRVKSYTLSALICSIHWLCDWWFRLYYHITYIRSFVASYLFLLWYYWFLDHCFVLLSGEIQFLSWGFSFLAPSMFSCVRSRLLVA